jgi:hypothetical protein
VKSETVEAGREGAKKAQRKRVVTPPHYCLLTTTGEQQRTLQQRRMQRQPKAQTGMRAHHHPAKSQHSLRTATAVWRAGAAPAQSGSASYPERWPEAALYFCRSPQVPGRHHHQQNQQRKQKQRMRRQRRLRLIQTRRGTVRHTWHIASSGSDWRKCRSHSASTRQRQRAQREELQRLKRTLCCCYCRRSCYCYCYCYCCCCGCCECSPEASASFAAAARQVQAGASYHTLRMQRSSERRSEQSSRFVIVRAYHHTRGRRSD